MKTFEITILRNCLVEKKIKYRIEAKDEDEAMSKFYDKESEQVEESVTHEIERHKIKKVIGFKELKDEPI